MCSWIVNGGLIYGHHVEVGDMLGKYHVICDISDIRVNVSDFLE